MDQVNQVWVQVSPVLNDIWGAFRAGFYEVNNGTGILIGFVAAYLMASYRQMGVAVLGSVVAVQAWWFLQNGLRQLPPLVELGFWLKMLEMSLGFLLVVSVFYFAIQLFRQVFNSGGHAHGH